MECMKAHTVSSKKEVSHLCGKKMGRLIRRTNESFNCIVSGRDVGGLFLCNQTNSGGIRSSTHSINHQTWI